MNTQTNSIELIQWLNLETRGNKISLDDYEFSIFKSLKKTTRSTSSYLSFSNFFTEIYKNNKKLRVGMVGASVIFHFNNEYGINLFVNKSDKFQRLRCSNRALVQTIFENLGADQNKSTNHYVLEDLGNNTYSVKRKTK